MSKDGKQYKQVSIFDLLPKLLQFQSGRDELSGSNLGDGLSTHNDECGCDGKKKRRK